MFFTLSSPALGLLVFGLICAAMAVGHLLGRRWRVRSQSLREPFAILQTALLGVVGLLLAFGLALAMGRHETRRAAVVDDANAIGTTFLRAQTLAEPMRSRSLDLIERYTSTSIELSSSIPGSEPEEEAVAQGKRLQRELWALANDALVAAPQDSAPRLYVESLNEMIDMQTVRVSAVNNRVPPPVLTLELVGAAAALGLLACYMAILGRGVTALLLAAVLLTSLLLVTFDLDRPTRGVIRVPSAPLTTLHDSMLLPPAAGGTG